MGTTCSTHAAATCKSGAENLMQEDGWDAMVGLFMLFNCSFTNLNCLLANIVFFLDFIHRVNFNEARCFGRRVCFRL